MPGVRLLTQFEPGKGYNIIGLTSVSFSYGKTEATTTFVYDSAGERVKKMVGGTTTTYLGKDKIEELYSDIGRIQVENNWLKKN